MLEPPAFEPDVDDATTVFRAYERHEFPEWPALAFLASLTDGLGVLTERNEFNSSFYTVLRAQPATPQDRADLLERRANVPREVSLVLAVPAGGNPREVLRLAEGAESAATGGFAAMDALRDESSGWTLARARS